MPHRIKVPLKIKQSSATHDIFFLFFLGNWDGFGFDFDFDDKYMGKHFMGKLVSKERLYRKLVYKKKERRIRRFELLENKELAETAAWKFLVALYFLDI